MSSPIPWTQFVDEVLGTYRPPMRAAGTLRAVRQVLRELAEVGVHSTSDFTAGAIGLWVERHQANRSAARTLSLLRALAPVARYAAQLGYTRANPFDWRGVRQWLRIDAVPSVVVAGRRHRSAAEIGAVIALADAEAASGDWEAGRLQALVYLLAYLGLRRGEALHLEASDVDLGRKLLAIRPKPTWRPKTLKSAALLPMPEPLCEVLARWIPRCGGRWLIPGRRLHGPWTGGPPGHKARDRVRDLGLRAGVEGLSCLSFRKSLGTLAKVFGVSQLELKAILRHTNVETQRYYDLEDPEVLRAGTSKIRYPRNNTA